MGMERVIAALEATIEGKSRILIKYNGGSQPGAVREIAPTKIVGDKVFAFCSKSNANKTFVIGKIEIENIAQSAVYDANFVAEPQYSTLNDVYETHIQEWEQYGWFVEFDGEGIGLYKSFKNGKRLKYPAISMCYVEEIYDRTDWDDEGNEIIFLKPNPKPWSAAGRYFKHFDKAVAHFIEQSRIETPIAGAKK